MALFVSLSKRTRRHTDLLRRWRERRIRFCNKKRATLLCTTKPSVSKAYAERGARDTGLVLNTKGSAEAVQMVYMQIGDMCTYTTEYFCISHEQEASGTSEQMYDGTYVLQPLLMNATITQ